MFLDSYMIEKGIIYVKFVRIAEIMKSRCAKSWIEKISEPSSLGRCIDGGAWHDVIV